VAVVERDVRIVNALGLHARPAAAFVKISGRFASQLTVRKDTDEVNGKSIMGMMTLAAERGSTLHLRAEGDDAEALVAELVALVERGFGEK
jgi:phosphocarrier protein